MTQSKVHSLGKVPFAWENAPGVCKASDHDDHKEYCPKDESIVMNSNYSKLPPPPCPSDSPRVVGHGLLHVPLPPCTFQPPMRSSSRKGLQREDPFLAAYMECTKSVGHGKLFKKKPIKGAGGFWLGNMFGCKNSCGIRGDSLVRLVHDPSAPIKDFRR